MSSAIEIKNVSISYNGTKVVKNLTLTIPPAQVTAIIGPSGCGKTTLLRSINRLSEVTDGCKVEGRILLAGQDIHRMDPVLLRRKIGMVFQRPNPFPKSVRDNVLYGIKATKLYTDHQDVVKLNLEKAALWHEVKDRLHENAFSLSVGQQQRLCLARCLAVSPDVILMDEPASSLDPLSTSRIESSIVSMKGEFTVVIVTHNMQQARRVADYTIFMYLGELIECGETQVLFEDPRREETKEYLLGRFG